jgi:hypothetical protein
MVKANSKRWPKQALSLARTTSSTVVTRGPARAALRRHLRMNVNTDRTARRELRNPLAALSARFAHTPYGRGGRLRPHWPVRSPKRNRGNPDRPCPRNSPIGAPLWRSQSVEAECGPLGKFADAQPASLASPAIMAGASETSHDLAVVRSPRKQRTNWPLWAGGLAFVAALINLAVVLDRGFGNVRREQIWWVGVVVECFFLFAASAAAAVIPFPCRLFTSMSDCSRSGGGLVGRWGQPNHVCLPHLQSLVGGCPTFGTSSPRPFVPW